MVRPAHLKVKGHLYFITGKINNNIPVFKAEQNAQIVQDAIYFGRNKEWYKLYGFVIMPDHIHLLLLPTNKNISEIMKSIKGYTARKINSIKNHKGKLWQEGFYDYIIDSPNKVMTKLRYIIENPVRKQMVDKPEDFKFSSAYESNTIDEI